MDTYTGFRKGSTSTRLASEEEGVKEEEERKEEERAKEERAKEEEEERDGEGCTRSVSYDEDFDPNKTYTGSSAYWEQRNSLSRFDDKPTSDGLGSSRNYYIPSVYSDRKSILSEESSSYPHHLSISKTSSSQRAGNVSPLLSESLEDNDLEDLKEGLKFALGTNTEDANWFPVSSPYKGASQAGNKDQISAADEETITATTTATTNVVEFTNHTGTIPLQDLSYLKVTSSRRSMDALSPFNDPIDSAIAAAAATSSSSHKLADKYEGDNSLITPTTLEEGLQLPPSKLSKETNASPRPARFADALTRISNRIAGAGDTLGNDSKLDVAAAAVTVTTPSSQTAPPSSSISLKTPIKEQSPLFFDVEFSPSKKSSTSPKLIPNVTITSDDKRKSSFRETTRPIGLGLQQMSSNVSNKREQLLDDEQVSLSNRSFADISGVPSSQQSPLKVQKRKPKLRLLYGNTLNFFSPSSKIRQFCHSILINKFTNFFMLVVLLLQVVLLSYRQWNPYALDGYFYSGYDWADVLLIIINVIYTVEIFAQIVSYGFINDNSMFEELGIPYPKGEFSQLYFSTNYLRRFAQFIGLGILFRKKEHQIDDMKNPDFSKQSDGSTDILEEVYIKDTELEGDISSEQLLGSNSGDLKKKYNLDSYHWNSKTESGVSSFEKELDSHSAKSFRLHSSNTFFKPESSTEPVDQSQLKRAFLRSSWHRIDFLSMIFFWISLLLSIDYYDAKHHIMIFRSLSCLRILRLCNLTSGTTTILTACKTALPQLIDVSIFIACFWLFFGIIGVQSFKSSLSRHCVWTNPSDSSDIWVNSDSYCGSFIGLNGNKMSYLTREGDSSGVIKGYRCPMYSQCISGENPYNGTVNFDNILQSLQMVFVVMSANTFTDIMYNTMDSDNLAACLFFIACIFVLTVWLLNVFIAVIVTSFNITRLEAAEEKSRKTHERWLYKIFGFSKGAAVLYNKKIESLKQRNRLLRYYYKSEFVFIIAIAASLFIQCFRSHNMSDFRRHLLYRFEVAFTIVFAVEIVLRFVFYFPKYKLFFYSKRNCFDLVLATVSVIIVIQPVKDKLGHAYYWLTVFQLMRFYRVVLATSITRNLWLKIMGNFRAIFDLTLFYFILLYLVSIILARYFEGAIPPEDADSVDFPMDTLPASFIALYVITSTENWTEVMYSLQQYATTTSSRSFGSFFLIAWFILSNMIILNIFIAVIAKTLEVSEANKRRHQLIQFIGIMTNKLQNIQQDTGLLKKIKTKLFRRNEKKDELEKAVVNLLLSGTAVQEFLDRDLKNEIDEDLEVDSVNDIRTMPSQQWKRWLQVNFSRIFNYLTNPFHLEVSKGYEKCRLENFEPSNFAKNIMKERNVLLNKQSEFLEANPRFNYVFYVMGPRHKFRRLCQRMVKPSYGERIDGVPPFRPISETIVVIMFFATIGLVVLACYMTPIYRMNVSNADWIFWSEFSFALVFTVEFLIKVIADGLIFTPNAYLRSSWNFIDFVVLISLWIEAVAYLKNDGNLSRIVRGLKALRALRLLTISETAKSNFHNTMIAGFWKILNAAIISLCLLFPFSIWGLNIFNGRLGYCLDGESDMGECYNEYNNEVFNWNVLSPNVYTNPQLEFNRFGSSFVTLFEIVSLEGWTDLLKNLINSTGVGTAPQTNASPFNGVFLVLFNFVSIVFILTLFVSVIISNYSRSTGRAYMTTDQISWYHVKKYLLQVKPSKRKDYQNLSTVKKFCYKMTVERNRVWSRILNCTLFMHTLALLLECFPSGTGLITFRTVVYTIASIVFFANVVMLAIAQGFKLFVHYRWNLFNLVISFGAFLTTLISFWTDPYSPFLNFNKLFLVAILLFVIPRSNRLSQLLRFASASLPSILSLSFTWIIVFLVFAIAMNQIFGLTKIGPNGTGNLNLRTVPKTLIVLFRCSFGEGWNYIMEDYTLASPFCTDEENLDNNDCGSKQYAYILFIGWNIISMYIFLNMFVSLILDSFDYINQKASYNQLIQREEIRKFKRTWQKFDPEGTGYIKPIELPKLLHCLTGALSFHFYTGQLEIRELCHKWIKRNNINDPYDVTLDYDAIEETFSQMDIPKIKTRRKAYEMFIEEALLTMELNEDPGISFTRILLQLPLYNTFDTGKCFNLIDYLERRLLVGKVVKKLHTKRVYETIAAYACRWKYQKNKRLGIKDADIAFDKQLKRASYLANENLWINTDRVPTIFVSDEHHRITSAYYRGAAGREEEKYDDDDDDDDDGGERKEVKEENEANAEIDDLGKINTQPVLRNSAIYGDHTMPGGVYYPNSPIVKTLKIPQHKRKAPHLSIKTHHVSEMNTIKIPDDDTTISPFIDPFSTDENQDAQSESAVQPKSVNEILESSPWGDTLRDMKPKNTNYKSH
ncbi:CCH1 [Candida oxycetoniae]|uniref:Calcium-channel protein CCH1 n=1 Tax=Candida oxycetoniae TaxID=497107 RepID=A0AAI9SY77_9ASCO|nr:CCH1 [Candida oxycetoniae]KAI3405297.2 CCH1 [Candida oxycetoniae]